MGNCFSGDDTSPENSAHPPPPGKDAVVVSEYNYNPRSTASASTSPLYSSVVDPKLVSLLDFFKQLHGRKKELFSEVIPVHGDEIVDVFRKIRKEEGRIRRPGFQLSLKRSHSAGAAEAVAVARGVDLSEGDLKLQRFKVKTLNFGDPPPSTGQSGGTGGGKGGGGK